jgi:hypothetical protein
MDIVRSILVLEHVQLSFESIVKTGQIDIRSKIIHSIVRSSVSLFLSLLIVGDCFSVEQRRIIVGFVESILAGSVSSVEEHSNAIVRSNSK